MSRPERPSLLSLSADDLASLVAAAGYAPMHAPRLHRAVLDGLLPGQVRGVPPRLIAACLEACDWTSATAIERVAGDDGSSKLLVRLADGRSVESVHLPGAGSLPGAPAAAAGRQPVGSGCLSSQVGCAVGCRFCASGLDRVARNLTAAEILEQVALLRRIGRVQRLVFMGSGEPSLNLRNLASALVTLRDHGGIGPRHVLVSTVGPAAAIDRLAGLGLKFTLAVSLHGADRSQRGGLIPTHAAVDPAELLDAADRFAEATGRAYQVEYVLLSGVNDTDADAQRLAGLLSGRRAHVSAIRWNAVAGMPFETPTWPRAQAFVGLLHRAGVSARLRRTVGHEATGACGQLRAQRELQIPG